MARSNQPRYTPEATIGPFFPGVFGEAGAKHAALISPLLWHRPEGQLVQISGRFLDADGKGVRSVILEIWQADGAGRYRHPLTPEPGLVDPQFDGFARLRSDAAGGYRLTTIRPGAYATRPGGANRRAPHLRFTIFASGIDRLVTEMFFEDDADNAADPLLQSLDASMRRRLIARRRPSEDRDGTIAYGFDVVMRGETETPFLDDWS
ncbi:MAG: protocatechuate 3,4-dioxygenase subunit alpha [Proteobacteria bacterium]|nr:protocatechuate 3,4-dioxygenase subunit alpha [Pseudomonadota bacterium]MBI3499773.1 protocatechuate 3,4-dioxygenase subunit alpha [Pseudomonadota bacterium]